MKRILIAIVLAATIPTFGETSSGKTENSELRIGLSQEFDSLHPMIASMLASNYLYNLVGRALVVVDENGKWVPQMAKSIPTLKNGGAQIIGTGTDAVIQAKWEILEKARWSDGTPITCADFKLSLDIANSGTVTVTSKEDYSLVKKIEWDNKTPKKCKFTYNGVRWDFHQIARFMPMPSHIEASIFNQYGKENGAYEKNSSYTKNPTVEGIYNGPYKVIEVVPGSHVVFAVNPYFYGPQPQIKRIVTKTITDTTSLEINLLTGSIDVIAPIGIGFDQALRLKEKVSKEKLPYEVLFQPSMSYEHIQINLDNPILKNKSVRQALMYGLNREEMVRAFFDNQQKVAHHFLAAVDPWHTSDPKKIAIFNYDKKKANALLEAAGWKVNSDDGYRYKDGQKLSLSFTTTAGNKIRETVQIFIQQQWKEIGVEVLIKNEVARVFFGDTVAKRKFPALVMFAIGPFPEKSPTAYHSKSIPNEKNGWSGRNSMGWSNAKADQTIDKIEKELDPVKRKRYSHKLQKVFSEEIPAISLFYRSDVAVIPTRLKNFKLTGHQFSETNKAEYWKLE